MVSEKVICSSIAMLQERFRQLEKVKEMREERELLKLPYKYNYNHPPHNNSHNLFFHSKERELLKLPTPKQSHQLLSLSLCQNSHMKMKKKKKKLPSWLIHVPPSLINNINETDVVDTTLHL
ncbi:hypothetical protein HanRHA438_Chr15g0691421 [Helianthus annuus]|nr:hypothetical protein HanRHA438_Chr15g0691421 [Helianthus annuus]